MNIIFLIISLIYNFLSSPITLFFYKFCGWGFRSFVVLFFACFALFSDIKWVAHLVIPQYFPGFHPSDRQYFSPLYTIYAREHPPRTQCHQSLSRSGQPSLYIYITTYRHNTGRRRRQQETVCGEYILLSCCRIIRAGAFSATTNPSSPSKLWLPWYILRMPAILPQLIGTYFRL